MTTHRQTTVFRRTGNNRGDLIEGILLVLTTFSDAFHVFSVCPEQHQANPDHRVDPKTLSDSNRFVYKKNSSGGRPVRDHRYDPSHQADPNHFLESDRSQFLRLAEGQSAMTHWFCTFSDPHDSVPPPPNYKTRWLP